MRQVFVFTLLCLSYSITKAQFEVNSYLGSYTSDFELRIIKSQREFLGSTNFNSPIVRELEVRIRAPEFVESPDDFRFRVSPINPWERKANKNYVSLLNDQIDTQEQIFFSQVLLRRYQLLIQLKFTEKFLEFYEASNVGNEKLISAYAQKQGSTRDIVRLKKEILKNKLEMEQLQGEQQSIIHLIAMNSKGSSNISLKNFETISVGQIKEALQQDDQDKPNIMIQNEQNKLRLAESEWRINKSESFSNLGFLQAEYRSDRGDGLSENLGWQLGFQIPIFNRDNPDLQRRKLDLLKDEQDLKRVEEEVGLNVFEYRNTLETLLQQYDLIANELKQLSNEFASEDIKLLIDLAEYKTDLEKQKLEIYQKLLTNYIFWLGVTDALLGDPLINQLSANKIVINTQ